LRRDSARHRRFVAREDRAIALDLGYGTMYGVHRTTIYLPRELKARVADAARRRGTTEAQVIRDAIEHALARPQPRGGLFRSERPLSVDDQERMLREGFGG
jgi:hypothetical protein